MQVKLDESRNRLEFVHLMRWIRRGTTIPVLRFTGPIGMATPLRPGLSLASAAGPIERAFADKSAPAVAIIVNSPGGSPVQSRLIADRIRKLSEEKAKPVYVFAEDVMASGGYLLALCGEAIYADESSIVGSIGVITSGFGFDRAIERLGIDRRVYTAGTQKMSLDPFQPEKADDVERLRSLQREVHQAFIAFVKERRGARLKGSDDELFQGAFWSGRRAVELGLVDGLNDVRTKMRSLYGEKVKLKLITGERGWLRRQIGLSRPGPRPIGWEPPSLVEEAVSALEARALWARHGM
ncbi:MAG: S49 family peptidase [Hyphomicrobiaceae bacterium]